MSDLLKSVPADQAQQINAKLEEAERKVQELYLGLLNLYVAVEAQYPYQSQHVTVEMRRARKLLESIQPQPLAPSFLMKEPA